MAIPALAVMAAMTAASMLLTPKPGDSETGNNVNYALEDAKVKENYGDGKESLGGNIFSRNGNGAGVDLNAMQHLKPTDISTQPHLANALRRG